jgi:hypothetical protein
MRTATVKGPGSKLHGSKARCCHQTVKTGEVVLWEPLATYGYVDDRFVIHAECVRAQADAAPAGAMPTSKRAADAQFAAIRRRQERLAAA